MNNKKYNPFADMYNFNANSSNWVQRLGYNADFYNNQLGYNSSPTPRPYDNTTASGADDDNEVISGFKPQTPRTTSLNNGFNVNKQQPSMGNIASFNLKGNNNASDFNANSNNWVQRLGHNADFYNNPLGYNSSPTPRPYDNTTASGINNSFNINNRQLSLSGLESYNQPQKYYKNEYDNFINSNFIATTAKNMKNELIQKGQAVTDMVKEYLLTKSHNYKNLDDYYHCKANYNATMRGQGGEEVAQSLGYIKELFDKMKNRYYKGIGSDEVEKDFIHDLYVNALGRARAKYQRYDGAVDACSDFRAKNPSLPKKWW